MIAANKNLQPVKEHYIALINQLNLNRNSIPKLSFVHIQLGIFVMAESTKEIQRGERFAFGDNWSRFLKVFDEDRLQEAETSLKSMLGLERFDGLTFLDAGSGSGLFSLAAYRLGARVHSFDYDPQSVATTRELRRRYCNNEDLWQIDAGSILDNEYLCGLGQFNIVYSWGVLHHTGQMWEALEKISLSVKEGGLLFISIYNDQGRLSEVWTGIKRIYNSSPKPIRWLMAGSWFGVVIVNRIVQGILSRRPLAEWFKGSERGMNLWHDTVDWIGGYPFETATPNDLINFFNEKKFNSISSKLKKGSGCNELVFRKLSP